MKIIHITYLVFILCLRLSAKEYHVAPIGNDASSGTLEKPFKTISKVAEVARPGDIVIGVRE